MLFVLRRVLYLFFGLLAVGNLACDEVKNCASDNRNDMIISFHDPVTGTIKDTAFTQVYDVGKGLLLYTTLDTMQQFALPLDSELEESTFIFESQNLKDTLAVTYVNTATVISEDCGVALMFSGLDTLYSSYDSVRIVERRLLEGLNENIRIYK